MGWKYFLSKPFRDLLENTIFAAIERYIREL